VMTDPALASGTDRCHAVVEVLDEELEIVINIQGDEPLLPGELLDDLVTALRLGDADVATPISRIDHIDDVFDENIVKVVVAPSGLAVYFSRSPVPFLRGVERGQWLEHQRYWKHLGIYAYTPDALRRHVTLPVSALERAESLEQLRTLEDGVRFRCVATEATMISVDVESDAERVRKLISEQ
jgi:3-deoxy-manno-octulosonate cytidylyltransferase (CMP-KDO synthetase)